MNIPQSKTKRYGLAVLAIIVSALLRWLLPDMLSQAPYLGFYPAVVVAATLGGVGPGLFATFGSLLFVNFVFVQFDFLNYGLQMRNLFWIIGGIGVSLLAGRLLDSQRHTQQLNVDLSAANDELRARAKELLEGENALRESEKKYKNIIDNLQDGYLRINRDGLITMASPSVVQMYGVNSADDMLGTNTSALYKNLADRSLVLEQIKNEGRVIDFQTEALRSDGTSFPVSINAQYFYDDAGQIQGIEAFIRDTTVRKRAEEALLSVRQRFQEIVDRAPIAIYVKNRDGQFVFGNRRLERYTGRPLNALIGKTDYDFAPKEDADVWRENDLKVLNGKEVLEFEETGMDADGRAYVNISIKFPLIDNSGMPVEVCGISTDITERKQAEKGLQELNEQLEQKVMRRTRFYALLAGINDAIVKCRDRQELLTEICRIIVETGEFRLAWIGTLDEASREIKPEASWGETSYLEGIRITANDEPEGQGPGGRAIAEGRYIVSVDFEEEAMMRPWRERARAYGIRSSSVFPLFHEGRAIGEISIYSETPRFFSEEEISLLLAISENVSFALAALSAEEKRREAVDALRQLNEELEQHVAGRTADLEDANKELEAFSYSVSHDLRAPLRHMRGFVELLQERVGEQLDQKSQSYMNSIAKASRKMGILIDDLLNFSRLGRKEIAIKKVSMNALVSDVVHELKAAARDRNIKWEVDALPEVYGDQPLLRIVLVNLISNAVKFTGKVENAAIKIGCNSEENEFVFYLEDNGEGFNMKFADKLFDVFQRLHTESEFEGTGIGLANVRRIISRHGGRTWAEGVEGKGATFYFTIPKKR